MNVEDSGRVLLQPSCLGGDSSTDCDPRQSGASLLGTSICDLAVRHSCKRGVSSLCEFSVQIPGLG